MDGMNHMPAPCSSLHISYSIFNSSFVVPCSIPALSRDLSLPPPLPPIALRFHPRFPTCCSSHRIHRSDHLLQHVIVQQQQLNYIKVEHAASITPQYKGAIAKNHTHAHNYTLQQNNTSLHTRNSTRIQTLPSRSVVAFTTC